MNVDEVLEAATADFFWVPATVKTVERAELAYSYAACGTMAFNRVVRARPELVAPELLVEEVLKAHRGGPSRWCLNSLSNTVEMRRALNKRGYVEGERYLAYAIRSGEYDRKVPTDVNVRTVETLEELQVLYRLWREIFGGAPELSKEDMGGELAMCTGDGRRVMRFVAYINDEAVGTGGMTFFDELSFGLIWAGGVVEKHRGQGVYSALLAARAAAAKRRGVARLGLYARERTSAPIVAAHGFERHGEMVYYDRY